MRAQDREVTVPHNCPHDPLSKYGSRRAGKALQMNAPWICILLVSVWAAAVGAARSATGGWLLQMAGSCSCGPSMLLYVEDHPNFTPSSHPCRCCSTLTGWGAAAVRDHTCGAGAVPSRTAAAEAWLQGLAYRLVKHLKTAHLQEGTCGA